MAAAIAAIIARQERDIVNGFRGVGATSPARARDPDELGVKYQTAFDRLTRAAVLRDAGDGRYYLDEPSWIALRDRRRRVAIVMLVVMAAVFAVLIATGALVSLN
jgi:hypothetical protein